MLQSCLYMCDVLRCILKDLIKWCKFQVQIKCKQCFFLLFWQSLFGMILFKTLYVKRDSTFFAPSFHFFPTLSTATFFYPLDYVILSVITDFNRNTSVHYGNCLREYFFASKKIVSSKLTQCVAWSPAYPTCLCRVSGWLNFSIQLPSIIDRSTEQKWKYRPPPLFHAYRNSVCWYLLV